jgi:hypothetical protein
VKRPAYGGGRSGADRVLDQSTNRGSASDRSAPAEQAPPVAGGCEPGEILFLRLKPCQKCPGRLLVGYILDATGDCHGWSNKLRGPRGRPDRCSDKVWGVTPEEAFGWQAAR